MATEFEQLKVSIDAQFSSFNQQIQGITRIVDKEMTTIETRTSTMTTRVDRALRQTALAIPGLGGLSSEFSALAAVAGGPLTVGLAVAAAGMSLFVQNTEAGKTAVTKLKDAWNDLVSALAHDIGGQSGSNDVLNREGTGPSFNERALRRTMPLPIPDMIAGAQRGQATNDALTQFHKDATAAADKADQDAAEKRQAKIDAASEKMKAAAKAFQVEIQGIIDGGDQKEAEALQAFIDKRQSLIDDADQKLAETRQAAMEAGVQNTEKFSQEELEALTEFHQDADEQWNKYYDNIQKQADKTGDILNREIGNGFADVIQGVVTGQESFGQALAKMAQSVIELTVRMQILKAVSDSSGGSGGLFGFLGGLFGIGGSASGGFDISDVPGRAVGGSVSAGSAYMVGEKGKELFVPGVSGTIYPSGKGPGGGNVMNVAIDLRGSNGSQEIQRAVQVGMAAALQQVKQSFPSLMVDTQMRYG